MPPRRHRLATLLRALDRSGGGIDRAARELGLGRSTLWYRLRSLGLLGRAAELRASRPAPAPPPAPRRPASVLDELDDPRFDRAAVLRDAVERNGGSPTAVARELGVSRQLVYFHLWRFGLRGLPAAVRARALESFVVD